MNPLSLAPERGGPKNLKKVEFLLSAEQDEENLSLKGKPRLVIVGGGWAAVGVLKKLSTFGMQFVFRFVCLTYLYRAPRLPRCAGCPCAFLIGGPGTNTDSETSQQRKTSIYLHLCCRQLQSVLLRFGAWLSRFEDLWLA